MPQLDTHTILQAIKRLAAILEEENIALSKMDIRITEKFAEEKTALLTFMGRAKKLLTKHPSIKQSYTPSELEELKMVYTELTTHMVKNFELLTYGKLANQKLLAIVKKALKHSDELVTYNKQGVTKQAMSSLNLEEKV